jgi:activator of HSP90 ATPase
METRERSAIKKYMKDVKEFTDRLAAIGMPVSEEGQVKLVHDNYYITKVRKVVQRCQ